MDSESLTARRCKPCEGGVAALTGAELDDLAGRLDGWSVVDGRQLEKDYRFKDFATALAFVNRLGAVAEEEGHHPDVFLAWGRVKVTLWTHAIGGLSENDFILAAKADAVL
ncbi:MAG TPA: 4a-hydroxytetrahydrobiopterin dehydratase [Acidobacteria bacterium]|nr:4a-hydroxytetrahydrobiopterin dehydratase [Acidobacteriota bacterium]